MALIGVDEASEEVFVEPVALWHRHFARLLNALAQASPRAVGVDVVPPRRSYDDIMPGGDLALFRAISYVIAALNLGLAYLVHKVRLPHAGLLSNLLVFLTIPFILTTSWPSDLAFLPFAQGRQTGGTSPSCWINCRASFDNGSVSRA